MKKYGETPLFFKFLVQNKNAWTNPFILQIFGLK